MSRQNHIRRGWAALMSLIIALPISIAESVEPDNTVKALNALLAASNDRIVRSSTCFGAYGQDGAPTIRDLLAVQLAYLYRGENAIVGSCVESKCQISITHAFGEDVSSATITFNQKRQRAIANSLNCIITP
jgi:hypothetical protein